MLLAILMIPCLLYTLVSNWIEGFIWEISFYRGFLLKWTNFLLRRISCGIKWGFLGIEMLGFKFQTLALTPYSGPVNLILKLLICWSLKRTTFGSLILGSPRLWCWSECFMRSPTNLLRWEFKLLLCMNFHISPFSYLYYFMFLSL